MGIRAVMPSQLLASLLLCASGVVGGMGGSLLLGRPFEQGPQHPERIVCKELQLESLVLVDRDGKRIGWMGATGLDGATLMLGRGEGRPNVHMQVDELEGTPSAHLILAAPEPVLPPAKPTPASASIRCVAGRPEVKLLMASDRVIELGLTIEDPETALSVRRFGGKEKTKWPK